MGKRRCNANGCARQVNAGLLMCRRHWYMVPKALRDRVWQTYRDGQDTRTHPTRAYAQAVQLAREAVAQREAELGAELGVHD